MIQVWKAEISLNIDWVDGEAVRKYGLHSRVSQHFPKYGKTLTIHGDKETFYWNGADLVIDLLSLAPCWHDYVEGTKGHTPVEVWDDGSPISLKQRSGILKYIYGLEMRRRTGRRRGLATYVFQWIKDRVKGKESLHR